MHLKFKIQILYRLFFCLYNICIFTSCGVGTTNIVPQNIELRNGDIIFRRGGSVMSLFVNSVDNKGTYTHVGIIVQKDGNLVALHSVPDEAPKGDIDRVKIESINDFFKGNKALNGAIYRTSLSADTLLSVTNEALYLFEQRIPFDNQYNLEDSTAIYCSELLVRSFNKIKYDITAGNFTELNILMFNGKHIFPSDILLNKDLYLIYSF